MSRAGRLARVAGRLGPPLALMGVIFALSAQPDLGTDLGWIDLVGRKLVHMAEYGLLWLLWLRALDRRRRAGLIAAAIAIGYAITDELHQTTVDGRHGSPIDVLIDSAGVLLAALVLRRPAARPFRERIVVPAKDAGSVACSGRRATEDARRRDEAPRN